MVLSEFFFYSADTNYGKNGSYFKLERVGQVQMSDGFEG
jgi:hypothetical protein